MLKRFITVILIIIAAGAAGLTLYLQYGLTSLAKKQILPAIVKQTGMNCKLDKVSANLFTGTLHIYGLRVINSPHFVEPNIVSVKYCKVDADLFKALTQKAWYLDKLILKDIEINIERNIKGKVNAKDIATLLQKKQQASSVKTASKTSQAKSAGKDLLSLCIATASANGVINFFENQFGNQAKIKLELNGSDIRNYGDAGQFDGALEINGYLMPSEKKIFDIDAELAPITAILKTTFRASGNMQPIELSDLKGLTEKYGLSSGTVEAKLNVECIGGVFNTGKSTIKLMFKNIQMANETQKDNMDFANLEALNINIPIKGTLAEPAIDMEGALQNSLFSKDLINQFINKASGNDVENAIKVITESVKVKNKEKTDSGGDPVQKILNSLINTGSD
jgi:hypothetical protein